MPAIVRRHMSSNQHSDMSIKDGMSLLNFEDHRFQDEVLDDRPFFGTPEEPMLFDFDDGVYDNSGSQQYLWNPTEEVDVKPVFPLPSSSPAHYELGSPAYPDNVYPDLLYRDETKPFGNIYIPDWMNNHDMDMSPISPTSPIPIPSSSPQSPSFVAYGEHSPFAHDAPFSPASFAAALPLPRSSSPSSSSFDDHRYAVPRQRIESVSPHETQTPIWATQLWDDSPAPRDTSLHLRTPSSPRSSARHSPISDQRHRIIPARRNSISAGSQLFPASSSAPSVASHAQNTIRSYNRRAESFSVSDDRDATVRRKKRISDESEGQDKAHESPPLKSMLRPPKLAPSAWQLYFTDWIQRQQASSSRKLNVAQAAKEAGQEYALLSEEEKEPYKRRSQAAKDIRERELNAYMHALSPEDIKRENLFRAAQRKAGKSRKSNIKDPNAPKKPLSAYFMFLQRIRANPDLVRDIFGDETETTKQSVLAAAKWRSMTDDERKPFLAQAEQEKMEYEAARRLYEDGTVGYGSSINFSILPGSPAFPTIKIESESESDFATDDGHDLRYIRS